VLPLKPNPAPLFRCPGCGRGDGAHPPLCPVALRLTAADAAARGGLWRDRLRASAAFFADLYGCLWFPAARHYREAAEDDPPHGDPGEPLVYAPADNLFRSELPSD
jgi:hypothetical protein